MNYFMICLHNILCKFAILKKLTLASGYYKSNFKLIKIVYKANVDIFLEKK